MNSLVGCCCCCCCCCCWRSKWFTVGRFQYVSVTLVQRSCTLLMVEVEQFLVIIMLHQLEVPKENVLVLGRASLAARYNSSYLFIGGFCGFQILRFRIRIGI